MESQLIPRIVQLIMLILGIKIDRNDEYDEYENASDSIRVNCQFD
jgi:hypothetical protein